MIRRRIDSFGRIVVPKEIRDVLNIHNGACIDISIVEEGILLRKGEGTCHVCGQECNADDPFQICGKCLREIRGTAETNARMTQRNAD